jgi:hypothetical protein
VSSASGRIGGVAAQQASGAAQQVWAINAINQALQNFSETAKDISHRTDQLSVMGDQVLRRRQEISPAQIDSILAYITRSVRDISVASKQQAVQYERMTGAMQAVIEIAEQVAGNSQANSESSERLELVVRQLRQLVGVRVANRKGNDDSAVDAMTQMGVATAATTSQNNMRNAKGASPLRRGAVARGPATGGRSRGMNGSSGAGMNMGGAGMNMGAEMGGGFDRPMPGRNGGGMGQMQGMPGAQSGFGQMPASASRMGGAQSGMGGYPGGGYAGGGYPGGGYPGTPMSGPMNGGGPGAQQPPDWRLPPLPEMPAPPDWAPRLPGPASSAMEYDNPGGQGRPGMARPSRDRFPAGDDGDGWPRNYGE